MIRGLRHVSLHKLTQDLSWLFAVMLQHDQRYLLAEAVYFLLAFFLTLSDHGRRIAKASKVPYDSQFLPARKLHLNHNSERSFDMRRPPPSFYPQFFLLSWPTLLFFLSSCRFYFILFFFLNNCIEDFLKKLTYRFCDGVFREYCIVRSTYIDRN